MPITIGHLRDLVQRQVQNGGLEQGRLRQVAEALPHPPDPDLNRDQRRAHIREQLVRQGNDPEQEAVWGTHDGEPDFLSVYYTYNTTPPPETTPPPLQPVATVQPTPPAPAVPPERRGMLRGENGPLVWLAMGALALAAIWFLLWGPPHGWDRITTDPNGITASGNRTSSTDSLTEAQVRTIVAEEVNKVKAGNPSLTPDQVRQMTDKAVADTMAKSDSSGGLTEAQVRAIVADSLKNYATKGGTQSPSGGSSQAGNFPPALHHFGDCPPQTAAIGGCSVDVGVHSDQIGLVFGVVVDWPKGNKEDATGRCDLVILNPGWYEDLHLVDGRFEVYAIGSDRAGWIKNLGEQRAKEQQDNYNCSAKSFGDIPQWSSDIKSPPTGVNFQGPTSGTQQPAAQNTPTPSSGSSQAQPQPAAAPQTQGGQPSSTCETVNCKERRGAGTFSAGEAVYGYSIRLNSGTTHSQCWLENAAAGGTVTDGVINPWKTEVASVRRCN